MAGVVSNCAQCGATLYDEETSYEHCTECGKKWRPVMTNHDHEHPHPHPHPPSNLTSVNQNLPERTIVTPMGTTKFRSEDLETKGYRWTFAKKSDNKLIELVYLKSDGSTGTLIADVDTLFDRQIVSKDNIPYCTITLKVIASIGEREEVGPSVELIRADVPIKRFNDINEILTRADVLDYFFEKLYGRRV